MHGKQYKLIDYYHTDPPYNSSVLLYYNNLFVLILLWTNISIVVQGNDADCYNMLNQTITNFIDPEFARKLFPYSAETIKPYLQLVKPHQKYARKYN